MILSSDHLNVYFDMPAVAPCDKTATMLLGTKNAPWARWRAHSLLRRHVPPQLKEASPSREQPHAHEEFSRETGVLVIWAILAMQQGSEDWLMKVEGGIRIKKEGM